MVKVRDVVMSGLIVDEQPHAMTASAGLLVQRS